MALLLASTRWRTQIAHGRTTAADGDTFERLVDEFQLRPADLLQMTEEQCQTTLRENEFPLVVVFTLQRRLREAYLGPHLGPPSSGGGVTGGG